MSESCDYREVYSAMADDELLNLARDTTALVPEAQTALGSELSKRRLGKPAIEKYATDVQMDEAAAEAAAEPKVAVLPGISSYSAPVDEFGRRVYRLKLGWRIWYLSFGLFCVAAACIAWFLLLLAHDEDIRKRRTGPGDQPGLQGRRCVP